MQRSGDISSTQACAAGSKHPEKPALVNGLRLRPTTRNNQRWNQACLDRLEPNITVGRAIWAFDFLKL